MTTYLGQANTGADQLVSSRSVSKPAGVSSGHVGVFWLARWDTGASFPAVTPPSGAVLRGTIATGSIQTLVYLHRVASETAFAYSWTGTRWSALASEFFSGVDPALDLSTVPFQSLTGAGAPISTLTVTTVTAAALAWHVNTINSSSGITHTPPTGYTETADVAPWSTAHAIAAADGSQSAASATFSPSQIWAAGLVALAPAASGTTGDAALAATAGLTAGGSLGAAGSSGLAATATLTAGGQRGTAGSAGLAATAALSASGVRGTAGAATLSATAGLAADGVRGTGGAASLALTASLSADGVVTAGGTGGAALAAAAALSASGAVGRRLDAALAASAVLSASGTVGATGGAGLAITATLHASGEVGGAVVRGIARRAAGTTAKARRGEPSAPWAQRGEPTGPTARGGAE
ncbi:hypothetical protein [Streptomyces sp. NPDC001089]